MGYSKAVPKLIVGRGESVLLEDGPATVIDLHAEPDGPTVVVVEYHNGDQRVLDVDAYIQAAELVLFEDNPQPLLADDLQWQKLPEETKFKINQRFRDLTLVETGDPDGDIFTGQPREGHVDPRYDPALYTLRQRRQRMSADIASRATPELTGTSADTLRRQASAVKAQGGRYALIHGRYGMRSSRDITSEVRQVVEEYVASELYESYRSIRAHVDLLRMNMKKAGLDVEQITDYRLKKLYLDAVQGKGYQQPTSVRRSKAARLNPARSRGWALRVPFSFIEVDSTPIDQTVVDQYGRVIATPHLLVAECATTRKVVGLRLAASKHPYDAREVKGLLWDCIRGRVARQSVLRATCLPDDVVFAPFQDSSQPTRIDAVNVDRGTQYNSDAFLGALRQLGINARMNDPARGVQKPHVEAIIRTLTSFGQKLPGYTGSGVHLRGRKVEDRNLLKMDDLLRFLWQMIDTVYHVRPHSRLFHPDYPGHRFSPNEYMALLLNSGGCLTGEVDIQKALRLLTLREASLQHKGLEINRRFYNSDSLKALASDSLGDRTRDGLKLKAYIDDRHPEYVLVRLPDGRLEVAKQQEGTELAPLTDLLDRDIRRHVWAGDARSTLLKDAREAEQDLLALAWDSSATASQFAKQSRDSGPSGAPATSGGNTSITSQGASGEDEQKAMLAAAMQSIRAVP